MSIENVIPVSEAADVLAVNPSRVRAMVSSGQLDAQKVAGRWLINRSSVERRSLSDSPDGRPFSPINAWALLCLASGKRAPWIGNAAESRLRGHLKRRSWEELAPRLRSRACPLRLRAHPSALKRLIEEAGVVLAGVSAASKHGIDIQSSDELEAYVYESIGEQLIEHYKLEPSEQPNVVLRLVPDEVPPEWQNCVGGVAAAIDLAESFDSRSRRAGIDYLRRIQPILGDG